MTKTARVLVTGATGYVAAWIVRRLLEQGHTVHATVRDPSRSERIEPLRALATGAPDRLHLFAADLLRPGSFADAMDGCEVVMHTASPFRLDVRDAQRDLVDPAVHGTREVIQQAFATDDVQRVVVTSSCAAVYGDTRDQPPDGRAAFDESDWNTSASLSHQPYPFSKTRAEREAWRLAAGQDRVRVVTVNPSFVLGPAVDLAAGSESIRFMRQLASGVLRVGVPDLRFGVVDVRDVADLHLAAAFEPDAAGRYIASGHDSGLVELAHVLRDEFGTDYPLPRRTLPKWLVWLVGPWADRALTRRYIARNVGYPACFDASRSRQEFGIRYRPLRETLVEMFRQVVAGVPEQA